MKKIWIPIIVIVVIIVAVVIFYKPVPKGTIKIGVIQTLSGSSAQYGQWSLEGMQLAIDEINNVGGGIDGKKLTFIVEDDQGDKSKAVAAAEKLINIDKVKIIIGPTLSSTAMAVAPIAEKNQVIMFVTVAGTTDLKYAGDFIFRNRESAEIGGHQMAEFAYNNLGLRKVALAYVNAENGISYSAAFKEKFIELGGLVTNDERFEKDSTDFRTILHKISKERAEAIYVSAWITETAFIVKQVKELGLNTKILTTVAAETPKLFEIAGKATEGIYLTSPTFDPKSKNPLTVEYLVAYKQRYGRDSEVFAANSYDAVKIISQAIKKVGYNTDAIRDYLYILRDYPGVSGITNFDEYGEAMKPVIIKTIKNGQFVPYED